jgi:hypothetical protein
MNVSKRSFILFHPANYALTELNGCVAPVSKLSGPGMGLLSRKAFNKLKDMVYKSLDKNGSVELCITSNL